MKKTIGILAHVDAGKTTFSERLLYHTGQIRSLGEVDEGTASLDNNEIERARGITIFADQAVFPYNGNTYYLIDTPGHMDFSAETERTLQVLDYAILLIGGNAGVQSHTITLFQLLEQYRIPVFLFINKCDMDGFDLNSVLIQLKQNLSPNLLYLEPDMPLEDLAQAAAEQDEGFMEAFFEENYSEFEVTQRLTELTSKRILFPVCAGSALKNEGIPFFLSILDRYTSTDYERLSSEPFSGRVYKIRHDNKNSRITFLKILTGKLRVKDGFDFATDTGTDTEKINEIRIYHGSKYDTFPDASAGDIIGVTGLKHPVCGNILGQGEPSAPFFMIPALQSRVVILDQSSLNNVLEALLQLEAEDPMLSITFIEELKEICIHIMGSIQLEILKQLISNRFHMNITFEKPKVLYQETIAAPVMGYGHFEPLRHYAEVNFRIEPAKRGSGISFCSQCPVDDLAINYQNLIQTHVFEKKHRGILTGSPLTDVSVILTAGRAHLKHTEGGDFREAVYRAIRQALEQAENILLEPYYRFEIQVLREHLGRTLSDLQKYSCEFAPPENCQGELFSIKGRGPVFTLIEYPMELAAATKGSGSISLISDGYEPCHNTEYVIQSIGYQKDHDLDNPSGSVFCAKGTSFTVPWDQAEYYMHCLKR